LCLSAGDVCRDSLLVCVCVCVCVSLQERGGDDAVRCEEQHHLPGVPPQASSGVHPLAHPPGQRQAERGRFDISEGSKVNGLTPFSTHATGGGDTMEISFEIRPIKGPVVKRDVGSNQTGSYRARHHRLRSDDGERGAS